MKETKIIRSYAKALFELGEESSKDICAEFTKFNEIINSSNDLENLLFLQVFSQEEKIDVLETIWKKETFSPLLKNFVKYLILEKRIEILPMIYKEVVVLDDHKKGFLRGVIEGREEEINPKSKEILLAHLKQSLGCNPIVDYKQNEDITAGFRVTIGDYQLDATIDDQLKQFRNSLGF